MRFTNSLPAVFFLFCCPPLAAQLPPDPAEEGIQVLVRSTGSTLQLRWAPRKSHVWRAGNQQGYLVERFSLPAGGHLSPSPGPGLRLTAQPIKPFAPTEMDRMAQTEARVSVIQEAIYAKTTPPSQAGPAVLRRSQELENRFGLALFVSDLSPVVASAAGLYLEDKNVAPGARYIYRVSLVSQPKGLNIAPGVVVAEVTPAVPLRAPEKPGVKFGDRKATLRWPIRLNEGVFTAYQIERSSDGLAFAPVSDLPYAYFSQPHPETAFYEDSLTGNGRVFHYRLRGITPFGEMSPPSETVNGQGQPTLSGLVVLESARVVDNRRVVLTWRFPAEHYPDIKGYFVSRSVDPNGPFQDVNRRVLSPPTLTYTDAPPANNTYYRIRVVGPDDQEATYSFPYLVQLEDNAPPGVPTALVGKIDAEGVATLTWAANADADLMGYRIFKANALTEEFGEVTRQLLREPQYRDTVNLATLTREVHYRIVAVDRNHNNSGYSAPYRLSRPDKVAPVAPVFTQTEHQQETVALAWLASSSSDVAQYELWRQDQRDGQRNRISVWNAVESRTAFRDRSLTLGRTYRYFLRALDSTGNSAEALSREIFFETGLRGPVSEAGVVADREGKRILFTWQYPLPGINRCVVYKATDDQPLRLYKTLEGNPGGFTDADLRVGHTYRYALKCYFPAGVQSELSKEFTVVY